MRRAVLASVWLSFGCTRTLPPLPPPTTEQPRLALDPGPIPADKGRVIIDSVGAPSRVYVERAHEERRTTVEIPIRVYVNGTYNHTRTGFTEIEASAVSIEPLCKTPCAADLPPGKYTLHFERDSLPDPTMVRRDTATVDFGPSPTVYRRAVGTHPSVKAEVYQATVSIGWIGAGLGLAGAGAGFLATSAKTDDEQRAAVAMLGLGAVITATGIVYTMMTRPDSQEGAGVQFASRP